MSLEHCDAGGGAGKSTATGTDHKTDASDSKTVSTGSGSGSSSKKRPDITLTIKKLNGGDTGERLGNVERHKQVLARARAARAKHQRRFLQRKKSSRNNGNRYEERHRRVLERYRSALRELQRAKTGPNGPRAADLQRHKRVLARKQRQDGERLGQIRANRLNQGFRRRLLRTSRKRLL